MFSNEKRVTFLISLFVCLLVIPAITSATGFVSATASDSYVYAGQSFYITGTDTAGSSVTISSGGSTIGMVNVNSDDSFSYNYNTINLNPGNYYFTVADTQNPNLYTKLRVAILAPLTTVPTSTSVAGLKFQNSGAVSIVAAGSQSYYIGDTIQFSGTDTAGTSITLSMGGSTIAIVNVNADNTWSYSYDTSSLNGITAGTYTFQASDTQYPTRYGTVAVILKQPFSQLTSPQSGSISVTSTPSGASAYIDNIYEGITPLTVQYLTPMSHNIQISYSGYTNYETDIIVYAGQTSTVNAILSPIPQTTQSILTTIPYPQSVITTLSNPSQEHQYSGVSSLSPLLLIIIVGCLILLFGLIAYWTYNKAKTSKVPMPSSNLKYKCTESQTDKLNAAKNSVLPHFFEAKGTEFRTPMQTAPSTPVSDQIKTTETDVSSSSIIDEPIRILKMRYANGEITTEEYTDMLETLRR